MSIQKSAYHFLLEGTPVSCKPFGNGHINRTYLVTTDAGKTYVLQLINKTVFRDPAKLMENAGSVTAFIRAKGEMALHFISAGEGGLCHIDEDGEYWRCYEFVEGFCMESPETTEDFYQSALAFGRFQHLLSDFPAGTLHETIPNFHNTPDRYRQLKEAIREDKLGRLASAREEAEFYLSMEERVCRLQELYQAGRLPLRVTHNDTKLNNVLLDANTHKPLCVLDLDTVMPGLSAYDFGDSIRFGAATAAEDEQDISKMGIDLSMYAAFVRGFLEAAPSLTEDEVQVLPLGALTMTVECGSRFLKDYLEGDVYFRTHYPEHNLVRCRTQMAMAADMLRKWAELERITAETAREVR